MKIPSAVCIAFALWTTSPGVSFAQLLAVSNIDEVCKANSTTSRRTIVYVDLGSLRKNETEWGLTILNKLELSPREKLTVLGVNPDTFEVIEVFESCFPILSKQEIESARKGRGIIDSMIKLDPEQQQKENIQTYESRLKSALNKLVDASVKVSAPKRKNILAAISVDKNRFREARASYRVVIYSDGVIVDPSISEEKIVQGLGEKYPASFSGAEVFVYGIRNDDKANPIEKREKAFSSFFLNNWAFLKSFSPSLPQQTNAVLTPPRILKGSFEGGGGQGAATVWLTNSKDDAVDQGWVTFAVGSNTFHLPFSGKFSCTATECKLNATASENIPVWSSTPYFRKNDTLVLAGKPDSELQGTLQSQTKEVFKGGANEVQYKLKVSAE